MNQTQEQAPVDTGINVMGALLTIILIVCVIVTATSFAWNLGVVSVADTMGHSWGFISFWEALALDVGLLVLACFASLSRSLTKARG